MVSFARDNVPTEDDVPQTGDEAAQRFETLVAFYEAFKVLLDEPDFDTIYKTYGDRDHQFADRAARSFAREVIMAANYETLASTAGLPHSYLTAVPVPGIDMDAGISRSQAFNLAESEQVHALFTRGFSRQDISNRLGIPPGDVINLIHSASDRRQQVNKANSPDEPRDDQFFEVPLDDGTVVTISQETAAKAVLHYIYNLPER